MKGYKKLLALSVFMVIAFPSLGQTKLIQESFWSKYSIRNYGVDDGIFSQQVYKIQKDKKGFYWIVSNSELLRFDGLAFKDFDKGSDGGTLYDMDEDSKGNSWIPSIGAGLYKFNGDSLKSYVSQTGELTKAVLVGENDSVFVGTYGNGLKVFYQDSVYQTYTAEHGLVGEEIWTLERDKGGRLWIGTNTGVSVLHEGIFKNFTTENGLPDNRVRTIKALENGEVWVGTDKEGIVIFKDQKPTKYLHTKEGLSNLLVQDIEQGVNGDVFIATLGGGVIRFNKEVKETISKSEGLISDEINTIEINSDGLILIGTEDGLSVLVPKFFRTLSLNGKDAFEEEAVTLNQDGEGRIWLGTYGKGYRVYEDGNWSTLENPPQATNGYAQSGTLDSDGNLWVGTQGSGVFKIEGNSFVKKFTTQNGLLDDYVRGLTFDKSGNLWVGSNKGISVFDSENKLIRTYSTAEEIPNPFCITLITANDGSIWYGSYGGGAVRFKDGSSTIFDTEKGLRSDQVLSIYEDSNNDIWIGTFNYGLSKVVGDSLFTFSPKDGLPSANYAGIMEDNSNTMWLATGNGITKVSLSDLNQYQNGSLSILPYHYFNKEDGLISDNLQAANNSTVEKLEDGTLLFASIDGVSAVNPEKSNFDVSTFQPYIDEIIIDEKIIETQSSFKLKPDDKKLAISYSAINFLAPNKTDFRVQLVGIDENWVNVEDRKTTYYDYLPDGDYTFIVSAIGPDGQWSDRTASISFTVLPPFYKTWWFMSLGLLGFIAIGAGGVQIRSNMKLQKLNRELETQQKIQKERERISRELHDNVGSQITNLITGIEISNLHVKKNQQDEALSLLENLDSDARSAMTDLRETIWLLDKEMVEFGAFVEHLNGYLNRQKRYLNGLEIKLKSSIDNGCVLEPGQSMNLTRIIQEALNNSRKYAKASEFIISFRLENQKLNVSLVDDGKGMDLDQAINKGNGIKNMSHRAEEMDAKFQIKSEGASGVEIEMSFEVKIP
ncbi:MAG: two-component regulator propeller domain-containing protein [Balneola sp.]